MAEPVSRGMQAKTIKVVLSKKTDAWLSTIKDEKLRKLARDDMIVTGGSIASMLLGEKVNDFDIYFRTAEVARQVAEYYVRWFIELHPRMAIKPQVKVDNGRVRIVIKSAGVAGGENQETYEYFETNDPEGQRAESYLDAAADVVEESKKAPACSPIFLTENAITLSRHIQLIIRFNGTPDEIHKNFDFVHCTSYWLGKENDLVLRPAALESLLCKQLRCVGSLYPICSVIRTRKFLKRGWSITAGQYLKILMQVSELDLQDIETLREQLTGVDSAYFQEIIDCLQRRIDATGQKEIDKTYLSQLIDRIF